MRNSSPFRLLSASCLLLFIACGPTGGDDAGTDAASSEDPDCSVFGTCEGGLTCCDGDCVDTERDPDHCGSCGLDCSAEGGFCSSDSVCSALSWNAICDNANLLALHDGVASDDSATDAVRDELASLCGVSVENAAATDASVVAADGRPLVGSGTTVVVGGGGFFQPVIRYAEASGETPIYSDQIDNGATSRFIRRDGGAVLATVPSDTTGEGEDWFTVYLVEEPVGGALLLAAYGFTMNGSRASGIFARDVVLADPSAAAATWYLVRWQDGDGTAGPSAGDTFDVVDSGS